MNLFRATCKEHKTDLAINQSNWLECPGNNTHMDCEPAWELRAIESANITSEEATETIRELIAELHGIANRLNAQLNPGES